MRARERYCTASVDGQAVALGSDERLQRRGGMVGSAILQQHDRAGGLVEHRLQEGAVGGGAAARGPVLPEK
jgi:hypothetical protein